MAQLKDTVVSGNLRVTDTILSNSVQADTIIKNGGTSSQFLKADGTVDSNTYALASSIPDIDNVAYIGDDQEIITYIDGEIIVDVSSKADKVSNATNGNFAALNSTGNLIDSGHKHSDYQAALVSGTNIKTVNNQSLLGSGNITIQSSASWGGITGTISSQTDLNNALNGKQATLVSGTNIKTINNQSLLGSGNIAISAGESLTTAEIDTIWNGGTVNA